MRRSSKGKRKVPNDGIVYFDPVLRRLVKYNQQQPVLRVVKLSPQQRHVSRNVVKLSPQKRHVSRSVIKLSPQQRFNQQRLQTRVSPNPRRLQYYQRRSTYNKPFSKNGDQAIKDYMKYAIERNAKKQPHLLSYPKAPKVKTE